MKLLRLFSTNNDGSFFTDFNEDITINENSKIALSQLSFTSNEDDFIINGRNDEMTIQLKNVGGTKTIQIPHQTVTTTNYTTFFQQITDLFNDSLTFTGKQIGGQFYIGLGDKESHPVSKEGFVNIIYQRSCLTDGENYDGMTAYDKLAIQEFQNVDRNITDLDFITYQNNNVASSAEINESNILFNAPICQGGSVFRLQVEKLVTDGGGSGAGFPTSTEGFVMGLSTRAFDTNNGAGGLVLADIKLGVYCDRVGTNYSIIKDGVVSTPAGAVSPNVIDGQSDNDVIEIRKSNGNWRIAIFQSGGAGGKTDLLVNHQHDHETMRTMYPFIAFKAGKTFTRVGEVRITFDPYLYDIYNTPFGRAYQIGQYVGQDPLNTGLFEKLETHTVNPVPVRPTGDALRRALTEMSVNFKGQSLSEYFGFGGQQFHGNFFRSLFVLNGFNNFSPLQLGTNYLVELQNIDIESFDSNLKGHRNIIKCVPVVNVSPIDSLIINYETSNLIFLDIRNRNKRTLRNIKARILDNFGNPVKTIGYSSMTLLLDN